MRLTLLVGVVLCGLTPLFAADSVVKLDRHEGRVDCLIDGRVFTVFHFDRNQPKPYFSPVHAADGAVLTRSLESPVDHPHHKGVWLAIDEVNDIKFWAEKGKIENASVELTVPTGNPATLRAVNHWLGAGGQPVLIETTDYSVYADRMLTCDVKFATAGKPVVFGDTKEGLFGIRVADTLRGQAGGRIVNAQGLQGEKDCWGRESEWVDYVGRVGDKSYGVAIFDHPRNFRPARFHVRDYGLFTLSPFGKSSYTNGRLPEDPYWLTPGKTLRLRYGLYVHDGDAPLENTAQEYAAYLKRTGND